MSTKKRIVIGMSGASGSILGVEVLKALKTIKGIETHLVVTPMAITTLELETGLKQDFLHQLCDVYHPIDQLSATIASGSFETAGMVVVPCSMKSLAGIASGYSDNLLLRAADVCLKERRKLVLVPRETPLNGIHLRNLSFLHEQGIVILPAMMTFYHKPKSIQDMINQLTGKILSQFQIQLSEYVSWQGVDDVSDQ